MFKKLLLMMLACLTALVFAGTGLAESDRPLQVVCTTFPQYDWARSILGEKDSGVELTLLLDSGVDLHSYQPTAADIARISTCDLFIYVGGESDEWVEDVLAAAQTPSLHALSLLSCVEAREEETVEGMQESDHHHDTAFTLEDIQNRTLEDFGGKWVSLWPMLKAGQLDAFLRHKAGESDDPAVTVDSVREKYIAVWACDAVAITVEGDTISFDDGDGQPELCALRGGRRPAGLRRLPRQISDRLPHLRSGPGRRDRHSLPCGHQAGGERSDPHLRRPGPGRHRRGRHPCLRHRLGLSQRVARLLPGYALPHRHRADILNSIGGSGFSRSRLAVGIPLPAKLF